MISAVAADRVRKVIAYALAIVLTLLIFRVLGRTANGTQSIADPELLALSVLAGLAFWWVRAARRVRRARGPEPAPGSGHEGQGQ